MTRNRRVNIVPLPSGLHFEPPAALTRCNGLRALGQLQTGAFAGLRRLAALGVALRLVTCHQLGRRQRRSLLAGSPPERRTRPEAGDHRLLRSGFDVMQATTIATAAPESPPPTK